MRPTLDQQRAAFAWREATTGMAEYDEEYKRVAKGAPALIMGSGLMPTLAFYQGKKDAHELLCTQIRHWLKERFKDRLEFRPQPADFAGMMNTLFSKSSLFYMESTAETLELLKWIRQFVDAVDHRKASENDL